MAKMTKTQKRNSLKSILAKSRKLWQSPGSFAIGETLSTQDYIAIEKIVIKSLKKLK
jgi:hypothetical protein